MDRIIILLTYCVLMLLVVAESAFPEDIRTHKEQATFEFNNDWFAPGGKDRWLTNQMRLMIPHDDWRYAIGNDIYTPTSKKSTEIPYGDRPWDGYTYLEAAKVYEIDNDSDTYEERTLAGRAGVLGWGSGSPGLQKWFHNDLGFGSDPQWVGVNQSVPAFEFLYTHKTHEELDSFVGRSFLTQSYGFRVGNVVDEIFLDQQVTKQLWDRIAGYVGVNGKGVAFNTTLDGRMFGHNTYTVDSEPFVASARVGFIYTIGTWNLGYEYQYVTEEFADQDGRHLFGRVLFGYNWY